MEQSTSTKVEVNKNNHKRKKDIRSNNILFRHVCPTDLPKIYNLERSSYPKDEAASKSQIQYRQHHAAPFFRCAVYIPNDEEDDDDVEENDNDNDGGNNNDRNLVGSLDGSSSRSDEKDCTNNNEKIIQQFEQQQQQQQQQKLSSIILQNSNSTTTDKSRNSINEIGTIIGFITATRCSSFTEESMKTHDPNGSLLAIHSVVIDEEYRHLGIGKAMILNYIHVVEEMMEVKMKQFNRTTTTTANKNANNTSSSQQQQQQPLLLPPKKNWNLITKIVLMSKMKNIPFYIKAGFQVIGKSPIVHGQDEWYDCVKPLKNVQDFIQRQQDLYQQQQLQLSTLTNIEQNTINSATSTANHNIGVPCWIVDSFAVPDSTNTNTSTTSTFIQGSGNPAGVVMITNNNNNNNNNSQPFNPQSKENIQWMQIIAKEFNLSETAFLWKVDNKYNNNNDKNHLLQKQRDDDQNLLEYNIRYYTCNGTEVDLCGHATLAASSVIFQHYTTNNSNINKNNSNNNKKSSSPKEINFHAKHNVILKAKEESSTNLTTAMKNNSPTSLRSSSSSSSSLHRRIVMEFPTKQVIEFPKGSKSYTNVISMLNESLFVSSKNENNNNNIHENDIIFIGVDDVKDDLFIELSSNAFYSKLPKDTKDINFKPMVDIKEYNRGVIISCLAAPPQPPTCTSLDGSGITTITSSSRSVGNNADFISRFFGPKVGINEDPVTGSAHCVLGPYYSTKVVSKSGRDGVVVGYQMSQRGGIVECKMLKEVEEKGVGGNASSSSSGMIQIVGTAVTAMSGRLFI